MKNSNEIGYTAFVYGNSVDELRRNAEREARALFGPEYVLTLSGPNFISKAYGSPEKGDFCAHIDVTASKSLFTNYGTVTGRMYPHESFVESI